MSESEPSSTNNELIQVVSFQLAQELYAVSISTVKEIILVEGITTVPQMPDCILGVINLRGQVIPVMDLRTRLGLAANAHDDHTRIMIARLHDRIVGLVVDAVSQVMKIPLASMEDAPDLMSGPAQRFINGIARLEDGLIICLDMEKVLDRSDLADLAQAEDQSPSLQSA